MRFQSGLRGYRLLLCFCFFFFQAEDGIRDRLVTGVQTCALPICGARRLRIRIYRHTRCHLDWRTYLDYFFRGPDEQGHRTPGIQRVKNSLQRLPTRQGYHLDRKSGV